MADGNTVWIACGNPLRQSIQAINIYFTPLFFKSLQIPNQNLAHSASSTHSSRISLYPSSVYPKQIYTIVYLDAMYFKVRSNGKIVNKAVYICLGYKIGRASCRERV